MGQGDLTQLGVGGILIYLVVKELFAFLKTRKNGVYHETSGEKDPSYWLSAMSEIIERSVEHVMERRNDKLRQMIREELRYFYGLGRKGGWDDPTH